LGLKLLIGAEIWPTDACGIVLLATERASYGRLARLLTLGKRRASKGQCQLAFDDVAEHAEGLVACVLPDVDRWLGQMEDGLPRPSRLNSNSRTAWEGHPPFVSAPAAYRVFQGVKGLRDYRELFGDRCYALAELHHGPDDRKKLAQRIAEARRAGVPPVAANDVRYHVRERRTLEDVLTAVRAGTTVAAAGELLFANAERHLKPRDELARLFADAPDCLRRTIEVADRCQFSLD
ncbi:MAG: error-prone DNA polymerase, partial [Pirellulales bacterium]